MKLEDVFHLAKAEEPARPECGAFLTKWVSPLPVTDERRVNCPDCLNIISREAEGVEAPTPLPKEERMRRAWTIQVVGGDTDLSFAEWKYLHGHSNERPARHKPPRMEDDNGLVDGVFEFYDVDYYNPHPDLTCTASMEVVPMTTGNVEFTVGDTLFTLSHLDRADMLRALLHDFHYSREIGGPGDDDDQL